MNLPIDIIHANYIKAREINIDGQMVINALPNIKLNLNSRTGNETKVRKKGGIVGC
jgi:hypothetical protein